MTRPRATLLLNPAARRGAAAALYRRLRPELLARYELEELTLDAAGDWEHGIARAVAAGRRTFLAAGGDGTVNALTSALVARRGAIPLCELTLGAVGLGSSNDFLKPVRTASLGVALRVEASRRELRDVARAVYVDAHGRRRERVFVVSGSLGVTASANAFFNRGDALLRALKPRWTGGAILYAALRTIARHRDFSGVLRLPWGAEQVSISNLSVLKTPFLSGALRYDTPVAPDDRRLAVNLCEGMGRGRLAVALASLARGRFRGRPGTRYWSLAGLGVSLTRPAELELDGETVLVRGVDFDLLEERLGVCA